MKTEIIQQKLHNYYFLVIGMSVLVSVVLCGSNPLCSTIHEKSEPEAGRQGVRIFCI